MLLHLNIFSVTCASTRLHVKGHVHCSPAFDIDYQGTYQGHQNTQVSEQANSIIDLSDFRESGSNMQQANFMLSFRFFQFAFNLRALRLTEFQNRALTFIQLVAEVHRRIDDRNAHAPAMATAVSATGVEIADLDVQPNQQ
jgi:hypothetical protein